MATTVAPAPPEGLSGDSATRTLTSMVRAMFPHPSFPDGPYTRCTATILTAGADDRRFEAQLHQGLRDLDAAGFGELDDAAKLAHLQAISATAFFEGVRARVITSLYDDREVWELLGYEGPVGEAGYEDGRFSDLDWLPDPRVEEAGA